MSFKCLSRKIHRLDQQNFRFWLSFNEFIITKKPIDTIYEIPAVKLILIISVVNKLACKPKIIL